MAEISAKLVMKLRDTANLPMMKCKAALTATEATAASGDDAWLKAAIEHLRKSGEAASAKFADRETPNGGIGMAISGGKGALVLLGCQTDFVSSNDVFKAFAKELAELVLTSGAQDVPTLTATQLGGSPLSEVLGVKQQQIGEAIRPTKVAQVAGASVVGYNHGGRVAALIAGSGDAAKLKMVAIHIASSNPAPVSLDRSSVDPALVKKEEEILMATPEIQAKPEAMRPKIVQGKLGRFFKENVLLEQEMLIDAEKGESVDKYAARHGLTITGFTRLSV